MNTHLPQRRSGDPVEAGLTATVVEYDGAAECTIYPIDATPAESVTTWLSARGKAFVSLDEMR